MERILVVLCVIMVSRLTAGLRILALHGSGGSPAKFEKALTCFRDSLPEDTVIDYLKAPFNKDAGYCWWNMNEGERSYNAKELQGLSTSIDLVERHLMSESPPIDVLLGHSQGAMMAAILLAKWMTEERAYSLPKVAFLSGSSYPICQRELFDKAMKEDCNVKTVHCIGRADNINPPDLGRRLSSVFQGSVVLEHGGGHVFPQDEESIQTYSEVLSEL